MKRLFKIAISCASYALRTPMLALAELLGYRRSRLVILYYHSVPASSLAGFRRHLEMLERRATVVRADWRGSKSNGRACAITFDDAFVSVLENAVPELVMRQFPCTIFIPAGFIGRIPTWTMETNSVPTEPVASMDLIKSLPSSLVTVGAHTVSHPYLSRVSRESARCEVEQARRILSEATRQDIYLMSFPYGDYNEEVVEICKEAGYEFVFGIQPRPIDPLTSEFLRGRVAVEATDGSLEFFLKMSGNYSWMSYASALKQLVNSAARGSRGRAKTRYDWDQGTENSTARKKVKV